MYAVLIALFGAAPAPRPTGVEVFAGLAVAVFLIGIGVAIQQKAWWAIAVCAGLALMAAAIFCLA